VTYTPDPQHLNLGPEFFDVVKVARFPKSILRFYNERWAQRVGLDYLRDSSANSKWLAHFARFEPLPQNLAQPLALRYHGHQFRQYNPDLGDGRGFLFAQLRDPKDGRLLDLGTKGSGTTPWSRRGDGRLTLKGAVREVLATEMLEALGVNTSKTFSVVETGENLERHDEPSPTRSAVLVRLSHSHIRFGSFQRPAALGRRDLLEKLLRHSVRFYYPQLDADLENTFDLAGLFLKEVVDASAQLCASWMLAGFVHGVLNTDNMTITGESFDYGPYRFLPKYDPNFTAAYFDQTSLYAYGRQPETVLWNLEQLASSLAGLLPDEELQAGSSQGLSDLQKVLSEFAPKFNFYLAQELLRRLGLHSNSASAEELVGATYQFLFSSQVHFELFFYDWFGGVKSKDRAKKSPQADLYKGPDFDRFLELLQAFEPSDQTLTFLQHSYFQRNRPCTLLIDEVEEIWGPIALKDDWTLFEDKIKDIQLMKEAYGVEI
jgi:uncharacterized protein YdiU (UPF0061 family)